MTLSAFRTFKGDIESRITGSLQFESVPANPDAEATIKSEVMLFETNEYTIQIIPVPRKLQGKKIGPDGTVLEEGDFDLFANFASDKGHRLKLILRCEDRNQYLGVARGDVYLRAGDDIYWWNFVKGYLGIWAQLMVVIALGVSFSTFLSAPVVVIATIVMMLVGFSRAFIKNLTLVDASGGGPLESFWRDSGKACYQGLVGELQRPAADRPASSVGKCLKQSFVPPEKYILQNQEFYRGQ